MPWQRSERATSRSTIKRIYEAYRCPPAAYSRAKGRAWGRAARIFAPGVIAAAVALTVFLFIAVGHDARLQEGAEILRAADSVDGIPIASVDQYEEQLAQVRAAIGGSVREIVMYALEAKRTLEDESDGGVSVSALSILDAVIWTAESYPEDMPPPTVDEYFRRAIGRSSTVAPTEQSPAGPAEDYMHTRPRGMWDYLPDQGGETQGEPYGYN
jgi:hypothetical protein